jgi:hypothetical protein
MGFLITNKSLTCGMISPSLDCKEMSGWSQGSGRGNAKKEKINTTNLILKQQLQDRVTSENLVHLPSLYLGQGLLTISASSYRKWGQLCSKGCAAVRM